MNSVARLVLCLLCTPLFAFAQPPTEKKGEADGLRDEHRMLAKLVGTFDVQQKEYSDKGDVAEEWTGTLERTLTLDGRCLEEMAIMMGKSGVSKNLIWIRFDARKGKFVSVAVNTQSTLPLLSEGTWDKEKKEITFLDEELDPKTKKLVARMREVYRITNDDEQTFEEYVQLGEAKEQRTLEIRYRRKK